MLELLKPCLHSQWSPVVAELVLYLTVTKGEKAPSFFWLGPAVPSHAAALGLAEPLVELIC